VRRDGRAGRDCETLRQQTEQQEETEQGLPDGIGEAQGGGALPVWRDWPIELLEGSFAKGTIMAERLDVEQTSVGREADLPQGR
jgi:hypothetical protein